MKTKVCAGAAHTTAGKEATMDMKLHFLDSFPALGDDGVTYKVMAYERMRHDDSLNDALQQNWVSTGVQELRLDSGELVEAQAGGTLHVVSSGVRLKRA
jgi:hypothetical protein